MRIFLICSKQFYTRIPEIQAELESAGHIIALPNSYEEPFAEDRYRDLGTEEHAQWKGEMLKHSTDVIEKNDAVLVLNFEKNSAPNYIGGATFLEMYDAFRLHKKIYLYNDIPEGILRDEIVGFAPTVIHGNLRLVR